MGKTQLIYEGEQDNTLFEMHTYLSLNKISITSNIEDSILFEIFHNTADIKISDVEIQDNIEITLDNTRSVDISNCVIKVEKTISLREVNDIKMENVEMNLSSAFIPLENAFDIIKLSKCNATMIDLIINIDHGETKSEITSFNADDSFIKSLQITENNLYTFLIFRVVVAGGEGLSDMEAFELIQDSTSEYWGNIEILFPDNDGGYDFNASASASNSVTGFLFGAGTRFTGTINEIQSFSFSSASGASHYGNMVLGRSNHAATSNDTEALIYGYFSEGF